MSLRTIDLSHVVTTGMAVYPGDPTVPAIDRLSEHGASTHQASAFRMGCHAGTHIDLPLHFKAGEEPLESFPLDRCMGRAAVVDAPEGEIPASTLDVLDLDALDFVVFRTGWERQWGGDRYYDGWPFLGEDAARRLADAGLKGVGLDTPSLDPMNVSVAHDLLAAAGLINIENMANLDALPADPFLLLVLPLRLAGAEASPVRACALVGEPTP